MIERATANPKGRDAYATRLLRQMSANSPEQSQWVDGWIAGRQAGRRDAARVVLVVALFVAILWLGSP
jgi:hypothetical protein